MAIIKHREQKTIRQYNGHVMNADGECGGDYWSFDITRIQTCHYFVDTKTTKMYSITNKKTKPLLWIISCCHFHYKVDEIKPTFRKSGKSLTLIKLVKLFLKLYSMVSICVAWRL